MSSPLHTDALRVLSGWAAPDEEQERLRAAYVEHLARHDDGVFIGCVPAHLTASAMVLDHTGDRVLLTLHRKGGFWGQLGGHCEPGDASLADAALREAREESGIAGLRLIGAPDEVLPVDLDRHQLSAAFGRCGEHLDVRYAAVAPEGAEPVISDESDDLAWFPVDTLPAGSVEDLGRLVGRARAALRAQSSESSSPAVADTPSR
ncbi:MAG TPA: NUDIX hydrolase [Actinomycetes bacterium]|nr:NUDIX hydrolase [Actinomycetes bacterium]